MDLDENLTFPKDEPDNFEKLMNEFTSQVNSNQSQVNQIINSIFSIDQNEVLHYQKFFILFLTNPPQFTNEILLSSEILSLLAIALSSFHIIYLDRPIHDSFIQSWTKISEKNEIDISNLFKLTIIFRQLISINDIKEKQLTVLASTLTHFLELDCLSNKFSISLISYLLNSFNFFFKKFSNTELKRKIISICYHYVHITFQPIKMIIASNFLIQNYDQYDECLQFITQSLQNFRLFHEDSLYTAFSTISNKLHLNLKNCSPWSIYDAFSIVSSFSISDSQYRIAEQQVNALLALNFFGVEKKINNEIDYFNSAINLLANEKEEVPLLQLCESFRFSPIISIRNYQIFTIFFIYSIKMESFLIQMDDKTVSPSQILLMMESFGRSFEYFKAIINSILFFNHEIENGMINTTIELKKPIMNQFIQTMKLFFQLIIKFSSKYEYPKDECTEYDDDCYILLDKFGEQCKNIIFIRKSWEIINYTSKRIFEFLSIFPCNILSIIFSSYVNLLFSEKASQLYVYVFVSFFANMKVFLYFLEEIYKETLSKIGNREFVKNATIFLKWSNQLLSKTPQKVECSESFINSTKTFFIQFFKFTFSTAYTISLHSSLLEQLIKMLNKLFNDKVLFKIIPVDVLVQLYFKVPSANKENKHLNLLMLQLFKSHKSVLLNFEWYRKLLLKYAILKPKVVIPAIKENNMIYDYKNTLEFRKFAYDLLSIFDSYSSNELRKAVLEMISYIPVKFTLYKVPPIVDISQYYAVGLISNDKMLIINGHQLLNYIREIITCAKPENQFEDFVNFVNLHSVEDNEKNNVPKVNIDNSEGLFNIFKFLGLFANSVIDKCESLHQFLFVQDIFTLIIQFSKNCSLCLPSSLTPSFVAHFVVSLAMNQFPRDEINLAFEDSPEYFSNLLSEIERVLYNVSYPCYQHAAYVGQFLIGHFTKSSIDILQMTKFVLNFILRQLDDQLVPSHHIITDDEIKFKICHFLPNEVFDIVQFLKENVYDLNAIDFIPLFNVKLPFIASFSLCEIISKSKLDEIEEENKNKNAMFDDNEDKKKVVDYLDSFAEIDLIQIVPLLLLFPKYQERFVNLCSESIKIFNPKNQPNPLKIPFIFCLLDLPQNTFKLFLDVLKNCFVESSAIDSVLIAECLKKANSILHLDSKKKSPLSIFVNQILTNSGFHDDHFISSDLSSFKYLFSLFILQPDLVITAISDQLKMLQQNKFKNSNLINNNFKYLVKFLSLPPVIDYLVENKEYKNIGKILLKIYYAFTFDITDSMISYFSFRPKIWSKFISRYITKEEYVFFFFENNHSDQLSRIINEIKGNTKILSEHLQNEFVQFFSIENPEISYKQIKESFMSYFTQKDRHFIQQLISYFVDNGEVWDIILSFIKSNKNYLLQALKLEIMKNDNHEFELLPEFVKSISKEYLTSFFDFFFECYHESVDIELLQNIIANIEYSHIPLFEKTLRKYKFNFEFDFDSLLNNGNNDNAITKDESDEWRTYELNLTYFRSKNFHEIRSILDNIDIDSPSYIFEEIEKLVLDENYQSINTLMMRFINQRNHFISILKFIRNCKTQFYENFFELFSNELTLFVSLNLMKTTEKNIIYNIDCFNVLCSFLPQDNQFNSSHLLWGKKLSEIANIILPVFVKDDNFFHNNYKEFNRNLVLLVTLFGSQCKFIKSYFQIISKNYYENNSLILQELCEFVPEIISHLEQLNPSEFSPFVSLLCEIVNGNKYLTFPYAIHALNLLNQKGLVIKKITGPFSMIIKGDLNEIPLSKLNFSFDHNFLNSFKNVFCRWFSKGMNTEAFSQAIEKMEQKNDLSNWILFARSQFSDDFNCNFKDPSQYNQFFSVMPFQIISKYRRFIVDESSIPLYYYKQLSSIPIEKDSNEKNPIKQFLLKEKEEKNKFKSFFKLFSIDFFYKHIISNTENRIILFKSISDSSQLDFLPSDTNISFYSGVSACIFPPDTNTKLNTNKNTYSSFQLLQDARAIIGIPKSYPNQIIERLCRAKDAAFMSLKSSEIVQFLCVCSLCHNPIVPPYFTRYHSIKLFENFNRILQFATTKGINVDFTPLDKSEPFITQSQCSVTNDDKITLMKTKENFLIYSMQNQFNNPRIWSDLNAIENDDILYLFLHSNILPSNAQKEVLKQIDEFPFRWSQILFDDINRGALHESFVSLVSDVFRIDYSSTFHCVTSLSEVKKLRSKSFFESRIMDEEHPSHNFSFIISSINKFFTVLPICAPLVPNGPTSSYNYPMHSIFLSINKENSSYGTIEISLVDGTRIKYLLTGMINSFNPELFILSHMINKIMSKRVYCRNKNVELFSPQIQLITSEKDIESKLYLVRTNASPLLQHSIYNDLIKVKREGKYPQLKNFNQFKDFKSSNEFYSWEISFLHRFAALSHLQVGLGLRVILPFHLLINESIASIEFLQLRKSSLSLNNNNNENGNNNSADAVNNAKIRIFGEVIKFISPKMALNVLPTAMVNIATSFKFAEERLSIVLNNLLGIGFAEKMNKFNESLRNKNGIKVVENLISSSCNDVHISDIPWF